jgi:hypothetical protein
MGSTTLLVGLTLKVLLDNGRSEYVFACVSVGDCKAYVIQHDTLRVNTISFFPTSSDTFEPCDSYHSNFLLLFYSSSYLI